MTEQQERPIGAPGADDDGVAEAKRALDLHEQGRQSEAFQEMAGDAAERAGCEPVTIGYTLFDRTRGRAVEVETPECEVVFPGTHIGYWQPEVWPVEQMAEAYRESWSERMSRRARLEVVKVIALVPREVPTNGQQTDEVDEALDVVLDHVEDRLAANATPAADDGDPRNDPRVKAWLASSAYRRMMQRGELESLASGGDDVAAQRLRTFDLLTDQALTGRVSVLGYAVWHPEHGYDRAACDLAQAGVAEFEHPYVYPSIELAHISRMAGHKPWMLSGSDVEIREVYVVARCVEVDDDD